MERPATDALLAYVRGTDEDDLSDYLSRMKMVWDWDDEGFRELVGLVTACLVEVEADDDLPRGLAVFFSSYLQSLEALMRNEGFEPFNRNGRTPEETSAYFAPRRELLLGLLTWFRNGSLPQGYEDRLDSGLLP